MRVNVLLGLKSLIRPLLIGLLVLSLPGVVGGLKAEAQSVIAGLLLPRVDHPLIYHVSNRPDTGSPPYVPRDIKQAYDFLPLYAHGISGNRTSIAIVDAYGDPYLQSDLSSFDSQTGLAPAVVNTYYPDGFPFFSDQGWALETALDVEWAHAMAPAATIDLIVAFDNTLGSMYDGISYVASSLPNETVLSMSFGLSESQYPTGGAYTISAHHQLFTMITSHHTAIFASSGDSGASVCCDPSYPASDPLVVAVGGTSLLLDTNSSYISETAWSGSGAGSSQIFPKPSWQIGKGDSRRDIVDVSYDADPSTGLLVVQGGSDYNVGGTSAGSPQWAALAALASQATGVRYGTIASRLYNLTTYHDVIAGSDGYFTAGHGWDYPTGLGTPDATLLIGGLTSTPIPLHGSKIFQGLNITTTGSLTVNAFSQTVSGTATVKATNSTSRRLVSARNYTITSVQLQNNTITQVTRLLLNVPANPYNLSANVALTVHGAEITGQVDVSRQVNISGTGTVNINDVGVVTLDFGRVKGDPLYNPRADLAADDRVDLIDVGIMILYFGAPVFS